MLCCCPFTLAGLPLQFSGRATIEGLRLHLCGSFLPANEETKTRASPGATGGARSAGSLIRLATVRQTNLPPARGTKPEERGNMRGVLGEFTSQAGLTDGARLASAEQGNRGSSLN